MNSFLIGLQFLTRIFVVKQSVWTEQSFGESVKFFPAVGAVLGICYVAIVGAMSFLNLPLFTGAGEFSDKPEQIPQSLSPGFGELFEEIILRGQQRGEFRSDVPSNIIAEIIHSIFQTTAFSKLEISFRENIRLKVKILLDGIKCTT